MVTGSTEVPLGFDQLQGSSVQVGSAGKVVLPSETMSQSTNNRAPAWLQSPPYPTVREQ